jgi:hypothetical protein
MVTDTLAPFTDRPHRQRAVDALEVLSFGRHFARRSGSRIWGRSAIRILYDIPEV